MIQQPKRDSNNQVIPHDHPEISNDHEVIRRVLMEQIIIDECGNRRISSMLYKASTGHFGGMSVDLKQLIEKAGVDPKEWVTTPKRMGSVLFKVDDLRKNNFQVGYDPIEVPNPEPNPYHGEVWGSFSRPKIRELNRPAVWFVQIPDVNLT